MDGTGDKCIVNVACGEMIVFQKFVNWGKFKKVVVKCIVLKAEFDIVKWIRVVF